MSKLLCSLVAFAVLIFSTPWTLSAQDKEKTSEKVRIISVDGVDLNAHFYPCKNAKIKTPPTVLMLHALGENSAKKGWVGLAEELQKNAAVLTFDFRGHGQSTEITDPSLFWSNNFNRANIKGDAEALNDNKATIDYKEFDKGYHPALINDIAACRAFLERQNDTGACNTSSFIVIGAETGATLGAVWVNSEWHRHRLIQNPMNLLYAPDRTPEGRDIIACIWLSASSQFGTRTISVGSTLDIAMKQNAAPMLFIHSDEDTKGKAVATAATSWINTPKLKGKHPYTAKTEVKGGNLAGVGLLQKSLGVDKAISNYLFGDKAKEIDGIVDIKKGEWTEREFKKTIYHSHHAGTVVTAPGISANVLKDKNFIYDTYGRYAK